MTSKTLSLGKWFEAAADPIPENTIYFDGGGIKIGVEYRRVTDADFAHIQGVTNTDPDRGVSLHVADASDDFEYLRFDCFENYPHYHYLTPGKGQVHFVYDEVANGDMLTWSVETLRRSAPQMLELAGMARGSALNVDEVAILLDRVEGYTRKAIADQA